MRKKGNRKNRAVFLCAIVFILAFISGCGGSGDSATDLETAKTQLVGSWYYVFNDGDTSSSPSVQFYENGTLCSDPGQSNEKWGTWDLVECETPGRFTLMIEKRIYQAAAGTENFSFEIELDGDQFIGYATSDNVWLDGTFTKNPG